MAQTGHVSAQPVGDGEKDREIVQIVTVHGTNDTDAKTRGEQWWQKDSPFSDKVMSLLNTTDCRYHWVTHRWSGLNLQADRRRAGRTLSKDLSQIRDEMPSRTILIGHSHGGNVCDFAMQGLSPGLLNKVDVITIGTPILRHSYTVLDAILNAFKWVTVVFLFVLAWMVADELSRGGQLFQQPSPVLQPDAASTVPPTVSPINLGIMLDAIGGSWPWLAIVFCFACIASLPILGPALRAIPHMLYRHKTVSWFLEKLRLAPSYQRIRRNVRIYSTLDEAINGLRDLTREPVRLARPQRLWIITWVIFFFLFFNALYAEKLLLMCNYYEAFVPEEFKADLRCSVFPPLADKVTDFYRDGIVPVIVGLVPASVVVPRFDAQTVYLLLALAISASFALTATVLPLVPNATSWIANVFVRRLALVRAYGAPAGLFPRWSAGPNAEYVKHDDDIWRPLPIAFDHKISALTDRAASLTLRAARESMGVASVMKSQGFAASMSGALSWKELVHTTYFDVGLRKFCNVCETWTCECTKAGSNSAGMAAEPSSAIKVTIAEDFCFAEFIAHILITRHQLKGSLRYERLPAEVKAMYDHCLSYIAPKCEAPGYAAPLSWTWIRQNAMKFWAGMMAWVGGRRKTETGSGGEPAAA